MQPRWVSEYSERSVTTRRPNFLSTKIIENLKYPPIVSGKMYVIMERILQKFDSISKEVQQNFQ